MAELHGSMQSVVCTVFIVLIQLLEGSFYFLGEERQDKHFHISNSTTIYAVLSGRAYNVDVKITEIHLVPNQTDKSSQHQFGF